MKKLKTLKDISKSYDDWYDRTSNDYVLNDIKQLAEEWIYEYKNGYCFCHEDNHLKEWKDDNECVCFNEGVIWTLEKLFNIER